MGHATSNTRYAVIITRHQTHSEQPAAAVDDGDQDAHTSQGRPQPGPEPPSTAALRSVRDDDGGVVQEAVEDADGGRLLGQEPAPLLERPVRGDGQGSTFVGAGNEPEQQLCPGVVERGEAKLVDLCRYRHRSTYADPVTMPMSLFGAGDSLV